MNDKSGNKQRLLIVDDSKVIRVTARKILQNHFETVEALDGNSAWDILNSQEPFSLVVSDLTMPNLDGFGLLEKIRNSHLPHVQNIPVIIITGANDSEATMQRATAAGATDFIGKPFDSIHLLARTQAHSSSYMANVALAEDNITLEDSAQVDQLTGLANDKAFIEQGCQQLAYAIRHNTSLALASIEIDNFGDLVKQHDTDTGELAIKSVGSLLSANIRKEDVAARIGTARFALLLPGKDNAGVSKLSERITSDISKYAMMVEGKQVGFTVSIGITAPVIHADMSFNDLVAAAGDKLKQAMAGGGNRVMPDERHAMESQPDNTESRIEWTLEPFEKAEFCSAEQDETLVEVETLQADTMDPFPDMYTETATDADAIMLESEHYSAEVVEFTATAEYDTTLRTDTAEDPFEETIIITSPYSLYDLDEVEISSPADEPDTILESDSQVEAASPPVQDMAEPETFPATGHDLQDETDDSGFPEARPGMFRRMLRALFGRRY